MAMTSIRCPVLRAHVTCVTDLEGSVTRIICVEYDESTGNCRVKMSALDGGPLAQLLERMSEDTPNIRSPLCAFAVDRDVLKGATKRVAVKAA